MPYYHQTDSITIHPQKTVPSLPPINHHQDHHDGELPTLRSRYTLHIQQTTKILSLPAHHYLLGTPPTIPLSAFIDSN